jgi:DNA recombination protein RmuC
VEAYNKAVGSFESRVLVSARRFPSLGVMSGEAAEIGELAPIETALRHLQAVEVDDDDELAEGTLLALPEGGASTGTPA